ncbi:MAG: YbjN domain-containing protein [Rhizobiales bacterium]|nr:YbjN domain-containing protein [Hyphomicrobiales bacterium]
MAALLQSQEKGTPNPLDRVERLAHANDWFVDRVGDEEVTLLVTADWGDLHLCLNWRRDLEGLHLACTFDQRIPHLRREDVAHLLSLVNEQLYFGHFDIWREDGSIVFRNGLILAGGAEATEAQCESLIRIAIEACEQYYPAMQFVIWAGKSPEEAIAASLFETVGEA